MHPAPHILHPASDGNPKRKGLNPETTAPPPATTSPRSNPTP